MTEYEQIDLPLSEDGEADSDSPEQVIVPLPEAERADPESEAFTVIIPAGIDDRLDYYLALNRETLSRSYLHKLIKGGAVTVNGVVRKPGYRLTEGDVVSGVLPPPSALEAVPQDIPLDILYEDDDVLVINKPKGLVTHPAPGHPDGTLVNALLNYCGDQLGTIGGVLRPGIVQRLDKDTSGVMMIAKNDRAMKNLSDQIAERMIHKEYAAIVTGVPEPASGTISENLARSKRDFRRITVVPEGREAITHYAVEEDFGRYALVGVRIETGRTHQIRVHMQHIGHPVLGDPLYGPRIGFHAGEGQYLHARRLAFCHPADGREMVFEAPLPEDFARVLEALKANEL